jgi:hypothetical protein
MAPEALARRLAAALLVCCGCFAACSRGTDGVTVNWKIDPTPPVAGAPTVVRITLNQNGAPADAAALRLEAHMSHPGMAPVTTGMTSRGSGQYDARVELSMSGDWVFVVAGELASGRRITRQIDVPGVRPAVAAR